MCKVSFCLESLRQTAVEQHCSAPLLTIIFYYQVQIISNRLTFVLFKVKRILLVGDDLLHVDNTAVFELPQYLDLSNGCDGETLLFIV